MKKTIVNTLIIALAAGLGFTSITACDEPEEAVEPAVEEAPGEMGEAPDEMGEAPEPPGAEGAPTLDGPDEAPGGAPPEMGMDPMQDREVSDEDVDKFADVIEKLQELDEEREDPQARMEAADTPQERQAIQQEMIGEMQDAIEGAGMSFQEFMMMSQQLQQDPELRERLEERVDMEEIMGGGPEGGQPAPPQ